MRRFEDILKSGWKTPQLVSWLRGESWPPGSWRDEPYLLLLESVPAGADQLAVREKLAKAAGELLDRSPDHHARAFGALSNFVLSNLLKLCAGLALPSILGAPLERMRKRRELRGSQNGIPLESSLIEALAENQAGLDLRLYWLDLLREKKGSFPAGSAFDGFRGLIKCSARAGVPDIANVALAVGEIARYIERSLQSHWRCSMRELYIYADTYFELEKIPWATALDQSGSLVPAWAVDCFPRKLFPINRGRDTFVVPAVLRGCLPEKHKDQVTWRKDCFGGAACVVTAKNGAADFLTKIATPIVEQHRIRSRFETPEGRDAVLVHVFLDLERSAKSPADRELFREHRLKLLRSAGLLEESQDALGTVGKEIGDELASSRFKTKPTLLLLGPLGADVISQWTISRI